MLGYIRVIRQGQRYLELRGDRREIPFAKDYSHGRSSGHAITLRIGIIFFQKFG